MDITKIRSDKVGEARVQDQKGISKTRDTGRTSASEALDPDNQISQTVKNSQEHVKWSPEASMISEGVKAAKASDDVRHDRVKSLKDAIRNGTYKVDSDKVADAMIESSLEEGVLTRKA